MSTQLMNPLDRNATAIRLDYGGCKSGEQMARQLNTRQLFQFAEILFQCFETGRTAIGAKVVHSTRPSSDLAANNSASTPCRTAEGKLSISPRQKSSSKLALAERTSRSTRSGAKGSMRSSWPLRPSTRRGYARAQASALASAGADLPHLEPSAHGILERCGLELLLLTGQSRKSPSHLKSTGLTFRESVTRQFGSL